MQVNFGVHISSYCYDIQTAWIQQCSTSALAPRDQLSRNQLPRDQLPIDQFPTRSTVKKCAINNSIHVLMQTLKVQFGVSLRLNTWLGYFHHLKTFKKCTNLLISLNAPFFRGGWVALTAYCSNFISVVACSFLMTSTISKYLDVVCPQFASREAIRLSNCNWSFC